MKEDYTEKNKTKTKCGSFKFVAQIDTQFGVVV